MKNKLTITLLIILVLGIFAVGSIWSHRNTMVELNERINAQYSTNKSSYDNMWKKFREMTQVTDLQAEKIKDVYKDLIAGRYQDPNLLFKMVQENNPQLDQSTFTNLQNEIASSRNSFNNNQEQITDIIREYNVYIQHKPITAKIFGYTERNTNDFITTSDSTEKAFDTKKDDEIKLK